MKKHLSHLAAALAATMLFGAAVGPLSAAAATPAVYEEPAASVVLEEENAPNQNNRRSALNTTSLRLAIEYNVPNPKFQLYLSTASARDSVYQWYSSNPSVATVDNNGLVTAVSTGSAIIYANTYYTGTLQCAVTVTSNIGKVTLTQSEMSLEGIGGTGRLGASVAAVNGSSVPITWTSSNPSAATVDGNGVVTAVGNGEATITATAATGRSASCKVYTGTRVAELRAQREQDKREMDQMGWLILGGFVVLAGGLTLAAMGGN